MNKNRYGDLTTEMVEAGIDALRKSGGLDGETGADKLALARIYRAMYSLDPRSKNPLVPVSENQQTYSVSGKNVLLSLDSNRIERDLRKAEAEAHALRVLLRAAKARDRGTVRRQQEGADNAP